ncbi:MAG: Primosomal protein N' (replication factor Y) -superfamily II helicase, partial [uncultured Nocardioides sp.]
DVSSPRRRPAAARPGGARLRRAAVVPRGGARGRSGGARARSRHRDRQRVPGRRAQPVPEVWRDGRAAARLDGHAGVPLLPPPVAGVAGRGGVRARRGHRGARGHGRGQRGRRRRRRRRRRRDPDLRWLRGGRRGRHRPLAQRAVSLVPAHPQHQPADPQRGRARRGPAVQADPRRGGGEDPGVRLEAAALRTPAVQEGVRPRERARRLPPLPRRGRPSRGGVRRPGRDPDPPVDREAGGQLGHLLRRRRLPRRPVRRLHRRRPDDRGRCGPGGARLVDHQQHRQHDPAVRHQERGEVELELPGGLHEREARPRRGRPPARAGGPAALDRPLAGPRVVVRLRPWRALGAGAPRPRRLPLGLDVPAGVALLLLPGEHQDAPLHRGERAHGGDDGQRPGLPVEARRSRPHRRHRPRGHRRSRPDGDGM